jgi:hypothetical protein
LAHDGHFGGMLQPTTLLDGVSDSLSGLVLIGTPQKEICKLVAFAHFTPASPSHASCSV